MTQEYRFKTVREVLEYYMENHGFQVESHRDLEYMTRLFIEVMGNKRLGDLGPDHFLAYCSGRKRGRFGKKPAKSQGTLRRELQHLQAAINYCREARLVNPETLPKINLPDPPPPRDRWLTKKEVRKMRAAADDVWNRARLFVHIACMTGARKRAIETLRWDQVNLETNMIEFGRHEVRRTKKRKPTVPIHSELKMILEEAYDLRTNEWVLGTDKCCRAALDVISKFAGVHGVTPHVFRHTFAAHASMNGVPMTDIARILGDSVVTVEKTYAKFQPDYLRHSIEKSFSI